MKEYINKYSINLNLFIYLVNYFHHLLYKRSYIVAKRFYKLNQKDFNQSKTRVLNRICILSNFVF